MIVAVARRQLAAEHQGPPPFTCSTKLHSAEKVSGSRRFCEKGQSLLFRAAGAGPAAGPSSPCIIALEKPEGRARWKPKGLPLRAAAAADAAATARCLLFATRGRELRATTSMAATQQPELWDAQAMASAAKESAEHLAELRNHGMLGVQRAVTARAVALADAPEAPPGSETKVLHLVRHGQGFHSKRPAESSRHPARLSPLCAPVPPARRLTPTVRAPQTCWVTSTARMESNSPPPARTSPTTTRIAGRNSSIHR